MILGQTRHADFTRPEGANPNFRPGIPGVGFYSHFHPLTQVTRSMPSASGFYRPPLQSQMGPGMMPIATPAVAPSAPAIAPKAGGMAGSGFGSTGGVRGGHSHVDPYMVMRQGVVPGVSPSGSNLRFGVTHAGERVQRSLPFQQVTRSIMMPITAPPPAPLAPAAPLKGFGAPRRKRNWFSRIIAPETVAETSSCETIGPRRDGLMVTICNGRVTEYRDASGNVRQVASRGDYA